MQRDILPGSPHPLGATWDGAGVNFAIFSQSAEKVCLCLFHKGKETQRIELPERTHGVWHGYLPGVMPGTEYAYRIHGRWDPARGYRFNPAKLLLDPYARALSGPVKPGPLSHDYCLAKDSSTFDGPDARDNVSEACRSVVVDIAYDWHGDTPPATPLSETVIYETHVRGFTKLFDAVPAPLRGTYAGLGSPAAIDYFKWLGVSAVELLPVHAYVHDTRLRDIGLDNYWGYNSIAYFAPEPTYAASDTPAEAVREFKDMVRSLHSAGIEVWLDVVFNHTGEGSHLGPTLCFRGIDNSAYYRLDPTNPLLMVDFTGTGNSINVLHPRALQLICDSLRYWVLEMHVDGFRLDLATTLGRDKTGFDEGAAFFDIILQDPVLSQVKLIAEPWDLGDYGYQVGGFPHPWSEWNGRYRDAVRMFWKGDAGNIDDLASRVAGSSDVYAWRQKSPQASVNFVASHDGFTLRDLVSYNHKHNLANGEDNRDGDNHNMSWNCGVEGETDDQVVNALRRRQQRNFLATLFVSQGVPMLGEGDEYGRTKEGNNNTYCQDNELNWLLWQRDADMRRLEEYTRRLIQFRKNHPVFRQRRYLTYRSLEEGGAELAWFNLHGQIMTIEDWNSSLTATVGMFLDGRVVQSRDHSPDDTFLVIFHSGSEPVQFRLPGLPTCKWECVVDTAREEGFIPPGEKISCALESVPITSRSLQIYRLAEGSPIEAQHPAPPPPAIPETAADES